MLTTLKSFLASAMLAVLLFINASAQAPMNDEALRAAEDLDSAMGGGDLVLRILATMHDEMVGTIMAKGHQDKPHATEIVDQMLMPEFKAHIGELVAQKREVYIQTFTADEMPQIAVFFRSPVGTKYLARLPLIFQENREIGRAWGKRVALEAIHKHAQELRHRGITL